jgi:cephalosporin-C deacetylase
VEIHSAVEEPAFGFALDDLLQVPAPPEPEDFSEKWQNWYQLAEAIDPDPQLTDTGKSISHWQVFDLSYRSSDDVTIGGWLLLPRSGNISRGFVIGHGYAGRYQPDSHLPFADSALLFPCARGISRSRSKEFPTNSGHHVIYNIRQPDRYILRGCVEDTWLAISSLLQLYPALAGHIGYLGISFAGGVGALALAWEQRVSRAHFNIPSFGNQPLRMQIPSTGSAASVQNFERQQPGIALQTLRYFDAATAARHIDIPVHFACARIDPSVAPAGQFSIYNAVPGNKQLFPLHCGHMDYPEQAQQEAELLQELEAFFADM